MRHCACGHVSTLRRRHFGVETSLWRRRACPTTACMARARALLHSLIPHSASVRRPCCSPPRCLRLSVEKSALRAPRCVRRVACAALLAPSPLQRCDSSNKKRVDKREHKRERGAEGHLVRKDPGVLAPSYVVPHAQCLPPEEAPPEHTRTHTHTYTHNCERDPAREGGAEGSSACAGGNVCR